MWVLTMSNFRSSEQKYEPVFAEGCKYYNTHLCQFQLLGASLITFAENFLIEK